MLLITIHLSWPVNKHLAPPHPPREESVAFPFTAERASPVIRAGAPIVNRPLSGAAIVARWQTWRSPQHTSPLLLPPDPATLQPGPQYHRKHMSVCLYVAARALVSLCLLLLFWLPFRVVRRHLNCVSKLRAIHKLMT